MLVISHLLTQTLFETAGAWNKRRTRMNGSVRVHMRILHRAYMSFQWKHSVTKGHTVMKIIHVWGFLRHITLYKYMVIIKIIPIYYIQDQPYQLCLLNGQQFPSATLQLHRAWLLLTPFCHTYTPISLHIFTSGLEDVSLKQHISSHTVKIKSRFFTCSVRLSTIKLLLSLSKFEHHTEQAGLLGHLNIS